MKNSTVKNHVAKANEFKRLIKSYIVDSLIGYEDGLECERDVWNYIANRFYSEYDFMVKRYGENKAMREWLLGLALPLAFSYYEIEQLLIEWGIVSGKESENQLSDKLDNYWDRLAVVILKNIK